MVPRQYTLVRKHAGVTEYVAIINSAESMRDYGYKFILQLFGFGVKI